MRWKKYLLFFLTKGLVILLMLAFLILLLANMTWEDAKIVLIFSSILFVFTGYTMLIQWLDKEVNN